MDELFFPFRKSSEGKAQGFNIGEIKQIAYSQFNYLNMADPQEKKSSCNDLPLI
ncbi:MAG: hypothetical protein AB2L20_02840 [Mangrovibacterium sp.]